MLKYCNYSLVFIYIIFDKYIGVMVFEILMNKYYVCIWKFKMFAIEKGNKIGDMEL